MHARVVFESMFGNTERVARAVAEGLAAALTVETVDVAHAPTDLAAIDLLVVGGPTHAFGMSRTGTREDARRRGASHVGAGDVGVREWLATLQQSGAMPAAAAFDTRIDKPRVPGSAARGVAKRLRQLGCVELAEAENFFVRDVDGPLLDGELERARTWGADLAAQLLAAAPAPQAG